MLLPAHVVPEIEAPPNLSLFVGGDEGPVRELHRLYRGAMVVVHTRSEGRLLRAALAHLDGFADLPPGLLQLNARVLVRDGAALLVSALLAGNLDRVERRLERLGYQVVDVEGAPVDRAAAEVVLWSPRLEIDPDALADVERDHPRERREFPLAPARLPIRGLVTLVGDPETNGQRSPARRLVDLAHLVLSDDGLVHPGDLELLNRLDDNGLVTRVQPLEDRDLLELIGNLS
jgi:hypothetical protein